MTEHNLLTPGDDDDDDNLGCLRVYILELQLLKDMSVVRPSMRKISIRELSIHLCCRSSNGSAVLKRHPSS